MIERKIWRARDGYTAGIDQLLGYLTYADTRTAYVLLIRRQDVSSVVEHVKALTLSHSSCVDEQSPPGVGRIDYRFHATGDPEQPIRLVLVPTPLTTSGTGTSQNRGLPGGTAKDRRSAPTLQE